MNLRTMLTTTSVSVSGYDTLPPGVVLIHMPDETELKLMDKDAPERTMTLGALRAWLDARHVPTADPSPEAIAAAALGSQTAEASNG